GCCSCDVSAARSAPAARAHLFPSVPNLFWRCGSGFPDLLDGDRGDEITKVSCIDETGASGYRGGNRRARTVPGPNDINRACHRVGRHTDGDMRPFGHKDAALATGAKHGTPGLSGEFHDACVKSVY